MEFAQKKSRDIRHMTVAEVLALAIGVERGNAARYTDVFEHAEGIDGAVRCLFDSLCTEELDHAVVLEVEWRRRFHDEPPPPLGRGDVDAVIEAVDEVLGEQVLVQDWTPEDVLEAARAAKISVCNFYQVARASAADDDLAELFGQLYDFEVGHATAVERLLESLATGGTS